MEEESKTEHRLGRYKPRGKDFQKGKSIVMPPAQTGCQPPLIRDQLFALLRMSVTSAEIRFESRGG